MYTLGIETSCDETAAAILKNGNKICSNIVLSQTDLHKYFGGVIPELASRKHLEVIPRLVKDVVSSAGISFKDIGLIAVTQGPGLVGALLIGLAYAKALSFSLRIPFIGVNHIEAHLYANFMEHPGLPTQGIGLVVSGGHTTLVEISAIGRYRVLGQTLDDAAGEAFDKVAKLLNLGYPGGPIIDKLSQQGNPRAISFPIAMTKQKNYDFSFSGLKTSVVYYVKGIKTTNPVSKPRPQAGFADGTKTAIADLTASFQEAAIEQILKKTVRALRQTGHKRILLGGGVSRNSRLRQKFQKAAETFGWELYLPSPLLCTDNAAMIAGLGYARYKLYGASSLSLPADPRLGWNY